MKNSRRPHSKSRTGCVECKARKIKCDELKPTCTSCLRRGAECISPRDSKGARPQIGNSPSSSTSGDSKELEFSLADMGLFHHYITSTCESLTDSPAVVEMLRNVIPRMAYSYGFLMRGFLSISAFHLAYLNPTEHSKYALIGSQHHDLACSFFRAEMANITEKNCHALFAFSGSLITTYFAAAQKDTAPLLFGNSGKSEGVAEWILLVRGCTSLLHTRKSVILSGPLAPVLASVEGYEITAIPDTPDDQHIQSIAKILTLPPIISTHTPLELEAYEDAITQFRTAFFRVRSKDRKVSMHHAAYSFPSAVSETFIQLLAECRPPALVIMAHFCIILDIMRNEWYMQDKAVGMFRVIREKLGPEWHEWIEWPMEEIRKHHEDMSIAGSQGMVGETKERS